LTGLLFLAKIKIDPAVRFWARRADASVGLPTPDKVGASGFSGL